MRRGSASSVFLLLAGCHDTSALSALDQIEASSLIAVVSSGGEVRAIEAGTRTEPGGDFVGLDPFSLSGDFEVAVVPHQCPLDVLGLEPGSQTLENAPTASLEIPGIEEVFRAEIFEGEESALVPAADDDRASVLEALRRLDLPEDNLCRILGSDYEDFSFPLAEIDGDAGGEYARALLPEGDDLFLATSAGRFYRVSKSSGRVIPTEVPALGTSTVSLGVLRGSDEVWLFTQNDRVYVGPTPETVERFLDVDLPRQPTQVAMSDPDEPLEIFTVDSRGTLGRITDQGYELLLEGADEIEQIDEFGPSVVRLAPGYAIAVGVPAPPGRLTVYKDGTVSHEDVGAMPWKIARSPRTGTVVVSTTEGMLIRNDDEWTPVNGGKESGIGALVEHFWPVGESIHFDSEFREVGVAEVHPDGTACRVEMSFLGFMQRASADGSEPYYTLELVFPGGTRKFRIVERTRGKRAPDCVFGSFE